MHVKCQPAAGPEDAGRLAKGLPAGRPAADHAQRAEHRQTVVERSVGQAAEPAEVRLDPQEREHSVCRGLPPDHLEHRPREVDGGDGEPLGGEPEGVAARAAAQVHQPARCREMRVEYPRVLLEQRVTGEVGVLLGGQARACATYCQSGALTPSGSRQAGGARWTFMTDDPGDR